MTVPKELTALFVQELATRGLPAPTTLADGRLALRVNAFDLTVSLDNLARDFAADGDAGRVKHFVDVLVGSAAPLPAWPEVAKGLRFAAEPADMSFGDALVEPITDTLCRVVVYASPDESRITWLTAGLIADWGKSRAEVEALAAGNMAALLEETEFKVEDLEGHPLGLFVTNSAFKASLIFSPNLKEVVGPQLGWPVLMVIPCRDFATVLADGDHDVLAHVGPAVVGEYNRGAYPISTEAFQVSDDGIEAIGRFEAGLPEEHAGCGDDCAHECHEECGEMKTVRYRGGVVSFRIPADWEEEYEEEGGGTFYEDEPDSGTLRLNVITMQSPDPVDADTAEALVGLRVEETGGAAERLPNGNAVLRYRQRTEDEGEPVAVWFWEVAAAVPPDHARYAVFSYTVPAYRAEEAEVVAQVGMLDRELSRCTFAAEVGE
jgi:hypothetical protein